MKLYQYKQQLQQHGVLLSYFGPMRQSLLEHFSEILRQQLELEKQKHSDITPGQMDKVFHIFVEQAQNIARYSAELPALDDSLDDDFRNGIFSIGYQEKQFFVACCNLVSEDTALNLQQKLDNLISLSKDELKQLYRQTRKQRRNEGSKGAGLGLIDMTRHSDKIEYQLIDSSDEHRLFSLTAYI